MDLRCCAFAGFLLATWACGGQSDAGSVAPGGSCNGAEVSCGGGTTCLTESVTIGAGCSSMERICTATCADDSPCVTLFGAGATCGTSCNGGANVCVPPPS